MEDIKPGMRFKHARYIIGSPKQGTARPEVCTITKVYPYCVFYHNESGMKIVTAREVFPTVVKEWVTE